MTRCFVRALMLVAAASAVAAGQPSGRRAAVLAITHVTAIDPAAGTAVSDTTIVVDGPRIARIERGAAAPAGAVVVDGRGKFVIPGLWDMHVHLSYARSSALPLLVANGVTTVRDLGSDLKEIDAWRGQIAADALVGPTIIRAGPILNGKAFNRYQLAVTTAAEARMAVRTLQKIGVDLIKVHRQMPRDAFFAAADEAHALGVPVSGHIPVTVTPSDAADARPSSIEHTETLFEGTFAAAHRGGDLVAAIAEWRATSAAELFAKFSRNGIAVDPTLVAQEYVVRWLATDHPDPDERYLAASARREGATVWGDLRRKASSVVAARTPVVREMRAVTGLMQHAGVTLVAGTDTSFIHPPGFVLHDELALLVDAGLTAAEALRAATSNAAGLFPALNAGRVAADSRADLVILDGNPLADIGNTRRIAGVVLRGRYFDRHALDRLLESAVRIAAGS